MLSVSPTFQLLGREEFSFAKHLCLSVQRTQNCVIANKTYHIRKPEKYIVTQANTNRLAKSAIPFMQRILNSQ